MANSATIERPVTSTRNRGTATRTRARSRSNNVQGDGFVQTRFDWDAPVTIERPRIEKAPAPREQSVVSLDGDRPLQMRRGGMEHVGGPLLSVLGKYGLSVDDLLAEIDRHNQASQ